jgi:6-phosphogluconolactonase
MTPPENSRVIVLATLDELTARAAELFYETAVDSTDRGGFFTVALSGGSTPRPLHQRLAGEPYRTRLPWAHTHLFWADDRLVPKTDPASNFGTCAKDLLRHLTIPSGNIHPMTTHKPAAVAAGDYEHDLRDHFSRLGKAAPVFDLILLGIGEDGHTASIFPGDRRAVDTERWVAAVVGGAPRVDRLTLTLPVIDQARRVVFMVSGSNKAPVVGSLLTGASEHLPPRMIAPPHGTVIWLLDHAAAARLPEDLRERARCR